MIITKGRPSGSKLQLPQYSGGFRKKSISEWLSHGFRWESVFIIDPLDQPTVTACKNNCLSYILSVRTNVRPHVSNLVKQNKVKTMFASYLWDCGSGRMDQWWLLSCISWFPVGKKKLVTPVTAWPFSFRSKHYSKSHKYHRMGLQTYFITRLESYNDPRPSTNQSTSSKNG